MTSFLSNSKKIYRAPKKFMKIKLYTQDGWTSRSVKRLIIQKLSKLQIF